MNYIDTLNNKLLKKLSKNKKIICFGQNINTGSSFMGMTKNINSTNCKIINVQDSENLLTGLGFGMMINKQNSIYFLKQQDFLFLGMDHLVNTLNLIKAQKLDKNASYTIFFITTDSGYEGPQSRINKLSNLAELTDLDIFTISTKEEMDRIIKNELVKKGIRLITISQRLFKKPVIFFKKNKLIDSKNYLTEYIKLSNKNLIFSSNFSISYILENRKNINTKFTLANLSNQNFIRTKKIIDYLKKFKKIYFITDSKSLNSKFLKLLIEIKKTKVKIKYFEENSKSLYPNEDILDIDYKEIDLFFKK
tara:strand:+ start:491 stop:1411 length:921 start_codon:yes stop_codon:yes gene_type:complete